MPAQPPDPELDAHLADRLAEARDWTSFSRARPDAPAEVARETLIPGAEHLGGRTIRDRFIRGGSPTPVPAEPPRPAGLESHLKSRLEEVNDQVLWGSREHDALEAYQQLRRRWGGSP